MKVIGITGPSGAGKTTVLGVLEELGAEVIDCDAVYHRLLEAGGALTGEIRARFGDTVFDGTGRLDRKALGNVVFRDPAALGSLNEITHRHIRKEVERQLAAAEGRGRRAAAVDAIALLESGLGTLCGVTVAVTAPEEDRVRRLMAREGISEDYARARVAAQKPERFFEESCDYTLRNGGTQEELRRAARGLFERLL